MKNYNTTKINVDLGKITILTISGSTNLNILRKETFKQLHEILLELKDNESVKVLIITGSGKKCFSSGAHIKELAYLDNDLVESFVDECLDIYDLLENFPVPVISVLNGYALGAAFEMVIASDIRFMAEETKIGQPAVMHGLVPPFGGTQRLARTVGLAKAKEIVFSAQIFSSNEALKLGLVNRVYPRKNLMDEAKKFANLIANNERYSLVETKKAINASIKGNDEGLKIERNALISSLKSEKTKKKLLSFFDEQ